jgi:hypothetical protein
MGLPQSPVITAPVEKPAGSRTVRITREPSSTVTFSFFQLRRQGVSGQAWTYSSITCHFAASTAVPSNSSLQDASNRPAGGPVTGASPPHPSGSRTRASVTTPKDARSVSRRCIILSRVDDPYRILPDGPAGPARAGSRVR